MIEELFLKQKKYLLEYGVYLPIPTGNYSDYFRDRILNFIEAVSNHMAYKENYSGWIFMLCNWETQRYLRNLFVPIIGVSYAQNDYTLILHGRTIKVKREDYFENKLFDNSNRLSGSIIAYSDSEYKDPVGLIEVIY